MIMEKLRNESFSNNEPRFSYYLKNFYLLSILVKHLVVKFRTIIKIMPMKDILFIVFVFIIQSSFSQNIMRQEIFSFSSSERSSKEVKVFLVESKNNRSLIFEAYNVKDINIQSCSWKTKLSLQSALFLVEELYSAIYRAEESSNHFTWFNKDYIIKSKKRDRINIIFSESRCKREHKVGLFQKNCNKKFSIIFEKDIATHFIETISLSLNKNNNLS